jgi:broad specificity phosphatase PhoE
MIHPISGGILLLALASRAAGAQPATVILVRHAERATSPANDPGLTPEGSQRARDLAAALAHTQVNAIITTQFLRARLTAAPLAESLHLTPTVVATSGGAHADSVAAVVKTRQQGDVVLVVGHSNTVPAIIAALGGPKLPELCSTEYDTMFILELAARDGPRLIRASYGAPDPPGDADCKHMQP